MTKLTIYRGTHQIGGCCTEITSGGERILIDLGANLPGTDEAAPIRDADLLDRVLDGRTVNGVLFTHYHGDHCALYPKIAEKLPETPMYIGPLAKQILMLAAAYTNREAVPVVLNMRSYEAGKPLTSVLPGVSIRPFYADHSALDAYMFYIETAGKKILFTGDFRDHGIQGKQLWKMLDAMVVPKGVDMLITEGTMLSRERVPKQTGAVLTEAELGQAAAALFQKHKYNFVLASSTNLDSIMEFYHNTPAAMPFVCDFYQARLIVTAMEGMQRRGHWAEYRTAPNRPALRVLDPRHEKWEKVRRRAQALHPPLDLIPITEEELERDGFVLLARKNTHPESYVSPFDRLRDRFMDQDGQIVYSMWDGYLKPEHADQHLIDFIDGRPIKQLHTSGHAYAETIAKLIGTVNPKVIIPMHTERAEEFSAIPEFIRWKDRVKVLKDGEPFDLEML